MNIKKFMILTAVFCLGLGGAFAGQALRSGETAIYMKSGDLLIDRINDISSTRVVLETANNGEIPLRDVWMINFVNDKWDFPEERNQLETNDHYVFLKNGSVSSGRINDFSSDRRVFQFESGEEFPIGQIRRIYFAKRVPGSLVDQAKPPAPPTPTPAPVPTPAPIPTPAPTPPPQPKERSFSGVYERRDPRPAIVLDLGENGSARMEVTPIPNLPGLAMTGTWEATGPDQVTVRLKSATRGLQQRIFTFTREDDVLIGTGEVQRQYPDLRLRRR